MRVQRTFSVETHYTVDGDPRVNRVQVRASSQERATSPIERHLNKKYVGCTVVITSTIATAK